MFSALRRVSQKVLALSSFKKSTNPNPNSAPSSTAWRIFEATYKPLTCGLTMFACLEYNFYFRGKSATKKEVDEGHGDVAKPMTRVDA